MIQSITFEKPNVRDEKHSYALSLKCLSGKTFRFEPGLNIICGYNGCGKSSLINTIRKMTFCENALYSSLRKTEYKRLFLESLMEQGLFEFVDLRRDWRKSVFSLHPSSEIKDPCNLLDFGNFIDSAKASSGMDTYMAVIDAINALMKQEVLGDDTIGDFIEQVSKVQFGHEALSPSISHPGDDEMLTLLNEYFASHQVDSDIYTLLLDEPDRSLDICSADELFHALAPGKKDSPPAECQIIAVFHNPILLYRYRRLKDARLNWIELTPGYLDNVDALVEGRKVNKPNRADFITVLDED